MHQTARIIGSLSLVGFLISPSFAVSQDPLQQFKLASLAHQNRRLDSAAQEFEDFLKVYPSHRLAPQARLALGEIKFGLRKFPEAAEEYSLLIKKYGGTYEALNAELRLGHCEFNMKKYLNAIDHFMVVKNKAPKALRSEALLGWALSLIALSSYEKAENMLVELLQSYPKYKSNPAAVVPLGLLYMQRNRLQDALATFSLIKDDLGSRYYHGVVLRLLDQTIAASQMFKDVYEEDPNGFWADKAQLQMAEAYYKVNELNLAYDSFRKVYDKFQSSPLRPYALHRMACIQFHLGRFQEAGLKWEELTRTFEDDVNLPHSIYMLGEMALRQEEYGKAISFFSQIAENSDLRMDAQYKIIWCQAQQKQDDTAIARAEKFLKEYPWGELAAKTRLIKGICLQRIKKYIEANAEYQIVLDQFGKSVHAEKALYLMGTSYFQNKQLAEIVTSLNSQLKIASVSPSRWQAESYLWVAESYYALEQYEAAQRTYQLIVDNYKDTPKLANAMLGVAASLAKQGQYDEAAVAHERALAMAETTKSGEVKRSVLMDTAQVLFTQKKYEKAMGYFDEFINRYPDDPMVPDALFQGGVSFYRLEYYTEAIARWEKLANNYPTHALAPKALYEIAKTQFGLGKYDEAAKQFQLLIDKYPQSENVKDARIQIAQCYYNQGQFDLATKRLEEFLNNYPKDPKSKDVLELLQMAHYRDAKGKGDMGLLTDKFPKSKLTADIYWQSGADAFNNKQYKQALEFFRKLVGDFPDAQQVGQAYYYMAESHFTLEEYPNAVTAYKNFILNFPDHPNRIQALFRLGVSHFQTQNYREAVIAFNDTLEADPNGSLARDALINIPLCYKKLGQPAQALGSHERFLERYPNDPQQNKIFLEMGALNEEIKKYETAVNNYKSIPDSAEEAFDAFVSLGRVYRLMKLPHEEIKVYEKLRSKTPKSNEVRLAGLVNLGELYQEMGKLEESISVYEDIASNSSNPDWKQAALDRAKALRSEIK
ncbi:MAG: Outer membrane protein assembly factor BamD [Elusimicrobia bacterium]|nr:Outer membrane protein assembly factor BamD [Elusimicrobiota bacterium]